MKKLSLVALLSLATLGLASGPVWAWGCCNKCCYKFVCCCKQYNAFTPCCSGSIFCDGCACCQPPACPPCMPGCGPTGCTSGYLGDVQGAVQLPPAAAPATAPMAVPANPGYTPPQPLPVDGPRTSMRQPYYPAPQYYGQVQPVSYNPYYNGYYNYPNYSYANYGQAYNPGMMMPMNGGMPMSPMMNLVPPAYWYGGNMYGSSY